jgi:hypothetical protein
MSAMTESSNGAIAPGSEYADYDYTTGDPRSLLWEAMLDADYLSRYYGEIGSRYERYETWLHFATLLFSTGTVVSVLDNIQALGEGGLWAGRILALCTAAASLWMALKRYSRGASLASYLSSRWSQSQWEYERLWARVDELAPEEILHRIEEVRVREAEWDHVARREFHLDKKLAEQSFNEMLAERFPRRGVPPHKAAA